MMVTFLRELSDDIDILRSTWHHVPEAVGMRLQLESELNEALSDYEDRYSFISSFHFVAQRHLIRGKHHPGRKVLPSRDVHYEFVYDFSPQKDIDEEEFFTRLVRCCTNVHFAGRIKLGDFTEKEE